MITRLCQAAIISITLCTAATNLFAIPAESTIYAVKKIAKQKGTMGIIPYYVVNGKIYIFLGQELSGGKRESAGTFSDFGGTLNPNGQTVLEHALRRFREETMGQLKLHEEDVIDNGYLLYKNTEKSREIYYIFVKLTEKQYLKTKKMHTAKTRLKASGVPNSHIAKEAFLWVKLDDLMPTQATAETKSNQFPENMRFTVHTPEGNNTNILIRGYFLRDCLENPDFPSFVKKLSM